MKVIIVGRHAPDFGDKADGFEVVSQENVEFPTNVEGTIAELRRLRALAAEKGAEALLLQNTPVIVTAALVKMAAAGDSGLKVGAIVSIPGPRAADVVREFKLFGGWMANRAAEAIKFVNARARTEVTGSTLKVTVDPVSKFVFSHVEWLME